MRGLTRGLNGNLTCRQGGGRNSACRLSKSPGNIWAPWQSRSKQSSQFPMAAVSPLGAFLPMRCKTRRPRNKHAPMPGRAKHGGRRQLKRPASCDGVRTRTIVSASLSPKASPRSTGHGSARPRVDRRTSILEGSGVKRRRRRKHGDPAVAFGRSTGCATYECWLLTAQALCLEVAP